MSISVYRWDPKLDNAASVYFLRQTYVENTVKNTQNIYPKLTECPLLSV